jgi:phosphatidylglycerophosphatase A
VKPLSWPEWVVVTLFGAGHSPVAPATVASALTCVILWFVPPALRWPGRLLVLPVFFLGVWLSSRAIGAFRVDTDPRYAAFRRREPKTVDPDPVVIDEFVGQWITLAAVPHTLLGFTAAFVVFRVFDILKPLGIKWLQDARGGWGIMLDDVAAGLWGAVVLVMAFKIIPAFLK